MRATEGEGSDREDFQLLTAAEKISELESLLEAQSLEQSRLIKELEEVRTEKVKSNQTLFSSSSLQLSLLFFPLLCLSLAAVSTFALLLVCA